MMEEKDTPVGFYWGIVLVKLLHVVFWLSIWTLCCATGSCGCSRDYVGDYIDAIGDDDDG